MNATPPAAPPAEPEPVAAGAALAAARAAQNLGVADVARQLKLSVGQVEALESGAYERLPGAVFVRGFIRNYARLLKLDPEPLLRSVEPGLAARPAAAEAPLPQDIPFPGARPRRWSRRLSIAAALLLAAFAAYEFLPEEPGSAVTRIAPPAAAPVAAVPAPPPAAALPAAQQTAAAPAAVAPETPPAKPAAALPEFDRLPRPGERQIRLAFERESWVEIRDRDGRTLFSQLNPAGSEQRVNGLPPLTVVVGNAHGVRLFFDDKPVDLGRHTKVDVARLTLP
jgi:cytoskeleton protein RodZ